MNVSRCAENLKKNRQNRVIYQQAKLLLFSTLKMCYVVSHSRLFEVTESGGSMQWLRG